MTRTSKLFVLVLGTTALGSAAFAGSPVEAPADAQVYAPAPVPVNTGGDWTGFYTGLQFGHADADSATGALDGDDTSYGFHAGYDYDFGQFVLGGELDYDKTDISLGGGAASIDSVARAKIRGGYDLGRTLVYATAGAARADTSVGDETGPFFGLGVAYQVTDRYLIGAEVLEHRFDDVGGVAGNDIDATTFSIRGSLRF
ncbi:outer membrane protein [Sulfitobacter sp. MF3-043]|uniref:outer membrane protein n=1 Tax=Sulfitobacter sediminivivens TaxID=3252902 RepID=UPI0036DF54E9